MLTLSGAKSAAASSARGRHPLFNPPLLAAVALMLSGCMPATTPTAGPDPADPTAKAVGYRTTIAPYTSLRPATPAPWRERNDSGAPQPKQDR